MVQLIRLQAGWAVIVILVLAIFRLVPHPANATPIIAMALFAGASFSNRCFAFVIPIGAMLLSDLVLGFHTTIFYVYVSIAITVVLGTTLRKFNFLKLGVVALISSIIFFLATNFGAWLHHDMYPQNFAGLMQAYMAGIPFFRNTLLANFFFTYLVFYSIVWMGNVMTTSKTA